MKPLNQNLVQLIQLLSDGEYHDGTSIGKHLNITRAAVWKVIKKLEQYAIPFTSTKGKGYRLEAPLSLLDKNQIQKTLRHHAIELTVLEKTPSTNEELKPYTKNNQRIIACISETQTAGKGRLHRGWYSPFAENIYLSVLCPFEKDISELSGLSLVTGLSICRAIESQIQLKDKALAIKWPNDILVDGKKLAGTLIEIQAESNGYTQVIIGIGINVNMENALKKNIDQAWTSLTQLTEQYIDRNPLCTAIIDTLIDDLERFSSKGLAAFEKDWQERDYLAHSPIGIVSGNTKIQGICTGINAHGHLKVKTANGKESIFSSGDATIIK